jgi:predicted TPR repeat methyltransferase
VSYRRKEMIDQAIPEYEKATGLDPGNAEAWFDLGFMYKADHQNDKAVDAFNHYLELNKGKDAGGEKRIQDELGSLGATPKKPDAKTPEPKKVPKKK